MSDILKALKAFVGRDLSYVFAGSLIIASFLYLHNRMNLVEFPTAGYFVLAGISYVLSYVIRDTTAMIGLSPIMTKPPGKFMKWVYKRLNGRPWNENISPYHINTQIQINQRLSASNSQLLERIAMLSHLCSTTSPCFFLSGLILGYRAIGQLSLPGNSSFGFDLSLAMFGITISFALSIFAKFQAMTRSEFIYYALSVIPNDMTIVGIGDEPS
ncbi:hypothetical protein [Acaryochloris sp. IP29b_bin.137]|uniref:hypothetical protein n=1 Tax=Acaryochloris sp. IP29b_bin.137 TaxID=2969217 RepID=UPI0026270A6C|nr:hypothetical protein [Acaryochloris sp. IP29b_bin.137]